MTLASHYKNTSAHSAADWIDLRYFLVTANILTFYIESPMSLFFGLKGETYERQCGQ